MSISAMSPPRRCGMKVTAKVERIKVTGRMLRFRVDCYDECGLIGSGIHERTVIDSSPLHEEGGGKGESRIAA